MPAKVRVWPVGITGVSYCDDNALKNLLLLKKYFFVRKCHLYCTLQVKDTSKSATGSQVKTQKT